MYAFCTVFLSGDSMIKALGLFGDAFSKQSFYYKCNSVEILVTHLRFAGCLAATKHWMGENFLKLSKILQAVGRFIQFLALPEIVNADF